MTSLPFSWMWRNPEDVAERVEEQITPLLKAGAERELRNKRRRIRMLTRMAKARQLKGQV
jgi:hypothetical protein